MPHGYEMLTNCFLFRALVLAFHLDLFLLSILLPFQESPELFGAYFLVSLHVVGVQDTTVDILFCENCTSSGLLSFPLTELYLFLLLFGRACSSLFILLNSSEPLFADEELADLWVFDDHYQPP
jgi:hypothetical protein